MLTHFDAIDRKLAVLTWMVAVNLALTVVTLWLTCTICVRVPRP
jgi:hypothetical protein